MQVQSSSVQIPTKSPKSPATVRVAMWSARHRWLVFSLWFVFTLGIFGVSQVAGGFKTESVGSPGSAKTETQKARQIFQASGTAEASQDLILVVTHPTLKVTDPAYKEAVGGMFKSLSGINYAAEGKPVFAQVTDPYLVPATAGLISPDATSLRVVGKIIGNRQLIEKKLDAVKPVLKDLKARNQGFEIYTFNNVLLNDDINELVNTDLDGALKITLPITFVILLVAFGALVASIVPLVLAITSLIAAFGLLALYSQLINPVSSYATQLVVLIGLAVAVDYSLFMITRYRTERRNGRDKMHAIQVASSTAGRAVFFSGLTVAISVAGLFLIDDPLFSSMAIGTIAVVLIAIVGSLTFLPATLAILGNGVNWGRIPYIGREREEGTGFWSKLVAVVMRHPIVIAVSVTALLLVVVYPVTNLRLGTTDINSFPNSLEGVQALKKLDQKWPQGSTLQLGVVVTKFDQSATKIAADEFSKAALQIKGLSGPVRTSLSNDGKVGWLFFTMSGSQNDQANFDIVKKVRQELFPAYLTKTNGVEAYVTGDAAYTLEQVTIYTNSMPLVFGFVLGLSFLLLLIAFHSIVIPIKAILLNLLSTGASYGVLVLVFQEGWFGDWLGIKPTGILESWVPVLIFTILFGLSMDYHLFILTRIKESRDRGLATNQAVARGISITSGTITSAAAIMVAVFAVFVTLQLVIIRQIGLGLAVAVFIDATLIRCLLLPATMKLLGDWNWWMPPFLRWLPRVTIEGEEVEDEPDPPVLSSTPASKSKEEELVV